MKSVLWWQLRQRYRSTATWSHKRNKGSFSFHADLCAQCSCSCLGCASRFAGTFPPAILRQLTHVKTFSKRLFNKTDIFSFIERVENRSQISSLHMRYARAIKIDWYTRPRFSKPTRQPYTFTLTIRTSPNCDSSGYFIDSIIAWHSSFYCDYVYVLKSVYEERRTYSLSSALANSTVGNGSIGRLDNNVHIHCSHARTPKQITKLYGYCRYWHAHIITIIEQYFPFWLLQ